MIVALKKCTGFKLRRRRRGRPNPKFNNSRVPLQKSALHLNRSLAERLGCRRRRCEREKEAISSRVPQIPEHQIRNHFLIFSKSNK